MIEYLSIIIGIIITGITSQIPNDILPMLFQTTESKIAIIGGGTLYGYPFPFIVNFLGFYQSFDWIGLIIDFAIFSIIIYVIINKLKK